MIVPQSRLLFWIGAGVVPVATVATAVPALAGLALLVLAAFALAVVLDAALGYGSLDGIGVDLPEVLRLTKDREGVVELRIHNATRKPRDVRLGLPWPREIRPEQDDLLARLPAEHEHSRLTWRCTPTRRGLYRLERCYLETDSPLGFWATRVGVPVQAEVRVYPNLWRERKNLAALFLRRGNFGIHAQRQVGQGRDFEKLREYLHGDPLNEIHWKATAKRGRPVTKVFQIEKTQEVYVLIDASRLSARDSRFQVQDSKFATRGRLPDALNVESEILNSSVLERFVTAALVVGLAAEQQGDLFGLLTFGDRVQSFVRAGGGQAHYGACRDALYTLQPQLVTPDFDNLCTFARLNLRRRALLLVLTSLDDPMLAESFLKHVDLISRNHLVLVNVLRPAGAQPLFGDSNAASVNDLYERLGGHIRWHNLRELERTLQRRGVGFAQLDDERLAADLVTQYLNVKRRQLL